MSQEIINNDEECCSICLEIINSNNNKVITNCGHTFHCICLMKNVSINGFKCPLCRINIAEDRKTEDDSTSEEISTIANINEDILEYRNILADNIDFNMIDNVTAIINNNNNDENIYENMLGRFYSNILESRRNRLEILHRQGLVAVDDHVVEPALQAALRINNFRIQPPLSQRDFMRNITYYL